MRTLLLILLLAMLLAGCAGYGDPYAMRAAADAALEATRAAKNDRSAWATLSAAQTQSAVQSQADLMQVYVQATRQAFEIESTQAAATAQAVQTATAYPLTATPLAATQAALMRQVERDERRAAWGQITDPIIAVMPTVLLFVALGLLLTGAVLAFRRFLPVIEARGRAFHRGPHDSPVFVLQNGQNVMVVDPDRNFGPALLLGPNKAESSGLAPTDELQERVTGRDQLADLMGRLPPSRKSEVEEWMKRFLEAQALPAGQPKVEVIEPDSVGGWLAEVERKLLESGEDTL